MTDLVLAYYFTMMPFAFVAKAFLLYIILELVELVESGTRIPWCSISTTGCLFSVLVISGLTRCNFVPACSMNSHPLFGALGNTSITLDALDGGLRECACFASLRNAVPLFRHSNPDHFRGIQRR